VNAGSPVNKETVDNFIRTPTLASLHLCQNYSVIKQWPTDICRLNYQH